ncbi:MAG: hypothetical protein HON90_13410 [Halobacteriovoraceae bacterium]|jgi:hypothetical protein|nr:hypothetical protein [Halobacteriovoraceae bacterium]
MIDNYTQNKILSKFILRMDKSYSSFFYFTLEANENICFYSTLPHEKGQRYRDIVVYTTPELRKVFINILQHCKKNQEIEVLLDTEICDTSHP